MTGLLQVPDDASIKKIVENYWTNGIQAIFDGYPVEPYLASIDAMLANRETLIASGTLDPQFDWLGDLAAGRASQNTSRQFVPVHQRTRDDHLKFWEMAAKRQAEYVEKLALSGLNLIIGFHGAVALGALKVIAEKTTNAPLVISAAKVGLVCALIGIFLFVIGKWMAYVVGFRIADGIGGKLINPKTADFEALGQVIKDNKPLATWATGLIYGSLFWFLAYTVLLVLILLEA